MSALTRARKFDRVVFKDSSGKQVSGVALEFRSTYMLVGVTNKERPTITVRTHKKDGTPRMQSVPNNSIWHVPYGNVISTEMSETACSTPIG